MERFHHVSTYEPLLVKVNDIPQPKEVEILIVCETGPPKVLNL